MVTLTPVDHDPFAPQAVSIIRRAELRLNGLLVSILMRGLTAVLLRKIELDRLTRDPRELAAEIDAAAVSFWRHLDPDRKIAFLENYQKPAVVAAGREG